MFRGIEGQKRDYDFKRDLMICLARNIPPSSHTEFVKSAIENTHREETVIQEIPQHIRKHGKVAYVLDIPFSVAKTAIYTRALANTLVGIAGERRNSFIDMSLRTC